MIDSPILEAVAVEREAVTAARDRLNARLEKLDEIEGLAQTLDDSPAPKRPPAPPKPVRQKPRGLPPVLRSQPQRAARPATQDEMGQRRSEVLAVIRELEPVSFQDLLKRVDFGSGRLTLVLAQLRDDLAVRATGHSRTARWNLTETLDHAAAERNGTVGRVGPSGEKRCRDDVLATIRSEPGKWTEQRIADAGAWDREQVADACGGLLDEGAVELLGDGTYRPPLRLIEVSL